MKLFGLEIKKASDILDKDYVKRVLSELVFLGGSAVWKEANDNNYVKDGYQMNPTVYAIVNLIVNKALSVPLKVYEVKDEGKLKSYKSITSGVFDETILNKAAKLKDEAFEEVFGTELNKLLEKPNPAQTQAEFLTEVIAWGLITGNRYIYGAKTMTGEYAKRPKHLYPLPASKMQIIAGSDFRDVVSGYRLDYNTEIPFDADEVCHIKNFNPNYNSQGSHLYGQSPLRAGFRSLGINNEAIDTGAGFLQNQTARGVLSNDDGSVNPTQAKELKDSFTRQYKGSGKAGEIAVTAGKYSWINFGLDAADLALLEQYNVSKTDICNVYAVDPIFLGNTDGSTYNNSKEKGKSLWSNAVIPELRKLTDGLNKWLTTYYNENGKKYYIEFDYDNVPELQEDMDTIVDRMSKAYWVTMNEKRKAMGYAKDENVPEMDQYFIPANLSNLEMSDLDLENPKPINNDKGDVAE